jgi:AraC family transcriptional regulator
MTTLYIRNMVCDRCKTAVSGVLKAHGLHATTVALGEIVVAEDGITQDVWQAVDQGLVDLGFERIDDRKGRLLEQIKAKVISIIHHRDQIHLKSNWSDILSEQLHYEYSYLSGLFSSMEGITLEQYIIRQKIERVKELMLYDELSLSEIAGKLGYSSVAHLSTQFKKITGFTPSELRKSRNLHESRKPLDKV